jgi:hypothetical protein
MTTNPPIVDFERISILIDTARELVADTEKLTNETEQLILRSRAVRATCKINRAVPDGRQ